MDEYMNYIKRFDEIGIKDLESVGGKNASLGEMITQLKSKGIRIPDGFAITADAYWYYIKYNKLLEKMKINMSQLVDISDMPLLQKIGRQLREMIEQGNIPDDLSQEIIKYYHDLSNKYHMDTGDVAVRSSATAEDLATASFAGQQDTFLNVKGDAELLQSYKKCLASLFTDRAIIYRIDQGFDHFKVALSVGVQKMIHSDVASSGVAFSLDTETGFKDVITIESSYGLGESIVQGLVTPDEFIVHKPTLRKGYRSIIQKRCGEKTIKMVYARDDTMVESVDVPLAEQNIFSLQDDEILQLAQFIMTIEDYYSDLKKQWSPMDVEWAKDGNDGLLYIIQARPETVFTNKRQSAFSLYTLNSDQQPVVITTGLSIGQKIVSGVARIIKSAHDRAQVQSGDIIVTEMTDPDWVPVMKKAAGIITDRGGRTCHAAIVSRELEIPALVGTKNSTQVIKNGDEITIDCSQGANGYVYEGNVPFAVSDVSIDSLQEQKNKKIMVNCADPASAFKYSFLPVAGVGLARIEFIVTTMIQIHPMALLHPEKIIDDKIRKKIDDITCAYNDKKGFFVANLAYGIGTIAAAFYPRPVTVRFSDFKSNEYCNLLAGDYFEPVEENPMIGFRGASRYYDDRYKEAFALECAAIKRAREDMGLRNIKAMIPFVRTVEEAKKVFVEMERNGLVQGKNDLEIVMMCEVPSNVLLIDRFSQLFDGFSLGSNDLTQLVLGVDRDSGILAFLFDERDEAVKKMMKMAIEGAHAQKRYIGICGQAPSDYPEIADFLLKNNIDFLSLNSDAVITFLMNMS